MTKYNIKNQIMDDVFFCGCHPLSRRDREGHGIVISGFFCPHRRMTGAGFQSFCTREERICMGCEKYEHALEYSSREMCNELIRED